MTNDLLLNEEINYRALFGKTENALTLLSEIEKELPNEHLYFSLVRAEILKEVRPKESSNLFILDLAP